MTHYFKTRKEARQFCTDQNIRKKNIEFIGLAATLKTGYPWIVPSQTGETKPEAPEPFTMEVGKTYRLVDPELFVSLGSSRSVNRYQAKQIKNEYDSKVKILSIDFDGDYRYEVKKAVHCCLINKRETAAFELVEEPVDSLDSILDGGENLAPAVEEPVIDFNKPLTVQRDPDAFVVGRRYVLADKEGFLNANASNVEIVDHVDVEHNGVYTIGSGFVIRGAVFNNSGSPMYLAPHERRFFVELPDLPVVELPPSEPMASDLMALLDAAVKRHDDALAEVSNAFKEVLDIQRQIAKLNA